VSVDRSTIWPYQDGEPGEFIYQRYGHPTGVAAEHRLGELDGATLCCSRPAPARPRRSS
jgi:cystathionine beta-lyase/cystathionine gamma-synthase